MSVAIIGAVGSVAGLASTAVGMMGKKSGGGGGGGGKAPQLANVKFDPMPPYIPADWANLDQGAYNQDVLAYQRSDSDFLSRHPLTVQAEKAFEAQTAKDQEGDTQFIPQMQQEAMRSGLGSALAAFGDTGPTLTRGGAGEADVAKNLGLSVMGFQDRNRQNAQQSLSLAEQIFPRRQLGLTGADFAQVKLGDLSAQNAWNQANYSAQTQQKEFNANIQAMNQGTMIQQQNAQAQAQGQASGAQGQMFGQLAQGIVGTLGNVYGRFKGSSVGGGFSGGYGGSSPGSAGFTAGAGGGFFG